MLLFIVAVLGFIAFDATEDYRKQMHAAETFVPVQAEILASTAESHGNAMTKPRSTSWHPLIKYRYAVDGKEYTSTRYSYSYTFHNTESFVREAVAKHPAGKTVTAYYDPGNPKRAVLDNTLPDMTYFYLFAGAFCTILLFIGGIVVRHVWAETGKK